MKKIPGTRSPGTVLIAFFVFGLAGPTALFAATTPSFGTAGTFGALAGTFVRNIGTTTIMGDLGYTTIGGSGTYMVSGATHVADSTYNTAGADQNTALSVGLATQPCTFTFAAGAIDLAADTTHGTLGVYAPGVYCVIGAASIGTGGITLSGGGTYIFRIGGALTTVANSAVTLTGGAPSACDVFWTPAAATTLGANSTFAGTDIDGAGITVGSTVIWTGRALAFGGILTADTDAISVPTCAPAPAALHVVKVVANIGGGTAVPSDFMLHVRNASGTDVAGSPAAGTSTPGAAYSILAGTYRLSEDPNASYTQSMSGACDASGSVTLSPGVDRTCTITNTFITTTPAPAPATLHVVKLVVNGNGGTAIPSSFTVHVRNAGVDVAGSPAAGVAAPGTSYSLPAGTYTVSEDQAASYVQSFSGACDASGNITLTAGGDGICTIINTDIPAPPALVTPATGGGSSSNRIVPLIGLLKVPNPLALPGGSGSVTYDYTVWNVGGVQPLIDVTVTDDKCSPVTFVSGDVNGDGKLDLHESWMYSCTTTISTTTTDTAVATGESDDGFHQAAIATAVATVVATPVPGLPDTALLPPLINIVKVPSRLTPFPFGGGNVTYSYTVTNPGVVPMHDVSVTDNTCAPVVFLSGDVNGDNLLEPGESWAYSCRINVPISTRNTATAQGSANGFTALGYAFATVLVAAPGFPNTGFPPQANRWDGTASIAIFFVIASTLLITILKKRAMKSGRS